MIDLPPTAGWQCVYVLCMFRALQDVRHVFHVLCNKVAAPATVSRGIQREKKHWRAGCAANDWHTPHRHHRPLPRRCADFHPARLGPRGAFLPMTTSQESQRSCSSAALLTCAKQSNTSLRPTTQAERRQWWLAGDAVSGATRSSALFWKSGCVAEESAAFDAHKLASLGKLPPRAGKLLRHSSWEW